MQTDLLDWLDSTRIIQSLPPAQCTQQRAFVIEGLKPVISELESLKLSPLAISEALAFYSGKFKEVAQVELLEKAKNERP